MNPLLALGDTQFIQYVELRTVCLYVPTVARRLKCSLHVHTSIAQKDTSQKKIAKIVLTFVGKLNWTTGKLKTL